MLTRCLHDNSQASAKYLLSSTLCLKATNQHDGLHDPRFPLNECKPQHLVVPYQYPCPCTPCIGGRRPFAPICMCGGGGMPWGGPIPGGGIIRPGMPGMPATPHRQADVLSADESYCCRGSQSHVCHPKHGETGAGLARHDQGCDRQEALQVWVDTEGVACLQQPQQRMTTRLLVSVAFQLLTPYQCEH